ncbi:uncharacterized protein BDR25DRAFT_349965 [Lindgomyces ingoldianus]|uniref:Uncharacterized protein n=1 Tax=Lindgomyces ingoldianus TaxID=673940 RepID=A0ACB6R922_9PLEO|nr:uncharacterized protein BDR25DRAFT_349965 [Lindgomyces ingoldianus]KAF2475681.1 hypothetical protein BDR25DRAFT_349965 [Lindgomyces ingoldianus]
MMMAVSYQVHIEVGKKVFLYCMQNTEKRKAKIEWFREEMVMMSVVLPGQNQGFQELLLIDLVWFSHCHIFTFHAVGQNDDVYGAVRKTEAAERVVSKPKSVLLTSTLPETEEPIRRPLHRLAVFSPFIMHALMHPSGKIRQTALQPQKQRHPGQTSTNTWESCRRATNTIARRSSEAQNACLVIHPFIYPFTNAASHHTGFSSWGLFENRGKRTQTCLLHSANQNASVSETKTDIKPLTIKPSKKKEKFKKRKGESNEGHHRII